MGLAGTRNRRKLAVDPNNTKWTKDETTFGQRILRAHGWQPGQYLGPQDSAHANLLSSASSAPIKITLKDDTLGLGAKVRQKQSDQCTGLDVFKDLLGRLNGESDESLEKKKALRSDLKTSLYVERKFGPMRFVKGGLLVGDQITELLNKTADVKQAAAHVPTENAEAGDDEKEVKAKKEKREKKEKKSKKRKAEESDSPSESEADREERKRKKKRSKDESTSEVSPAESTSDSEKKQRKKNKKEKKDKKSKKTDVEDADGASDAKSKKKKDKKKRKEERADDVVQSEGDNSERSSKKKKKKSKHQDAADASDSATESAANSATNSGTSTPAESGTSTPQPLGRALVRSRYLASKRSAIADMQALNQILFIKPV